MSLLWCWVQSELLRSGQDGEEGQASAYSVPLPRQEHQKVELLRKAVQAHRAYTDRVSEPRSRSLLSSPCPFLLRTASFQSSGNLFEINNAI